MIVEVKVQDDEGRSVKGWERERNTKVPESLGMIGQEEWLSKAASSGGVAEGPLLDT